jgi:hypothetical protein
MKVPTVSIPVTLYLELARAYTEQPEPCIIPTTMITVKLLERRAYHKYICWKRNERKVVA